MTAYYNEIDPYAAEWLRNLIKAGHIADGFVDTRSIEDVCPSDLTGFTQCHFFAGIGGWSLALRMAGWDDSRPVWTGSCPCQPFSQAGEGRGMGDDRHLWPAWFHLIGQCRPVTVFGEQVEAAIAHGWLDLVQDDLEGIGYAFAPVGLPAASVGAPHIRHRLWFVANANNGESWQRRNLEVLGGREKNSEQTGVGGITGPLAGGDSDGRPRGGMGNANAPGLPLRQSPELQGTRGGYEGRAIEQPSGSPLAGFWRDADWIACRDGKARPTEPGTKPLAPRLPNHVGRLRAYGNGIVPQVAQVFIEEAMKVLDAAKP